MHIFLFVYLFIYGCSRVCSSYALLSRLYQFSGIIHRSALLGVFRFPDERPERERGKMMDKKKNNRSEIE